MIWYLLIGAVVGATMDIMRPSKHDNELLRVRVMVPVMSGLLWPIVIAFFVICFIRRQR
jgi:hypothetical protein